MRDDECGLMVIGVSQIPALGRLAGCRLRLDVDQFLDVAVVAEHVALLELHVADPVVVAGIGIRRCSRPLLAARTNPDCGRLQ